MQTWTDNEIGPSQAIHELRCMARRARAKWPFVLGIAVLVAGGVGYRWSNKPRSYESQVVVLAEETSVDNAPERALRHLASYFREVALNNQALIDILVKNYGPAVLRPNPAFALEMMRDRIGLGVSEDLGGHESRTYKIIVRYVDPNPEVALKVARDLSEVIVADREQERTTSSQDAMTVVSDASAKLKSRLAQAQFELAQVRQGYDSLPLDQREASAGKVTRAEATVRGLQEELALVGSRQLQLRLSSDAGTGTAGLSFRTLDPGQLASAPSLTRRQEAVIVAVLTFLVMLPIGGVLLVTLDWRVQDLDDLAQLNLAPFAAIPSLGDDDWGSAARRASGRVG